MQTKIKIYGSPLNTGRLYFKSLLKNSLGEWVLWLQISGRKTAATFREGTHEVVLEAISMITEQEVPGTTNVGATLEETAKTAVDYLNSLRGST